MFCEFCVFVIFFLFLWFCVVFVCLHVEAETLDLFW